MHPTCKDWQRGSLPNMQLELLPGFEMFSIMSFSYLSSLISHIEKSYGFVQDSVPKARWFTCVQENESAK